MSLGIITTMTVAWVPFPDLAMSLKTDAHEVVFFGDDVNRIPESVGRVDFWAMPHPISSDALGLLDRMTHLRVIQLLSSGVDHVLPYLPNGVALHNAPHLRGESTAEVALTLTLAALNDVPRWTALQRSATWEWLPPRQGLTGSSVLVVGHGNVGKALHRMLCGFNVDVTIVATEARPGVRSTSDLPSLLPAADVVVIAAPLGPTTLRMFGEREFSAMKDGALLVNVARGALVDTDALVAALRGNKIRAAVDVADPEPPPRTHPLWNCPNLLISPHVGGNAMGIAERGRDFVATQLANFHAGRPLQYRVDS